MEEVKWFDRKFNFDFNQNIFPSIIERLSGTPARLDEKFKSIPSRIQTERVDGKWTIKENLGHLTDLETLWQGRLKDILNNEKEMREADLENRKTWTADHNNTVIESLLYNFRKIRKQTVDLISNLNEEQIFKSSLHPRLKMPMRVMDLFLFVADHDDHHLARISELKKILI